ncbi:unnamed protein product [Clonostachys solani]|uniref:AA1-like domain-containing protein n=1 Tax=Clonostachys solani TaxID=160281 RepID=A0A9P0EIF6_9HYPO|nr:unnamed protein product [Clonostachys solani]
MRFIAATIPLFMALAAANTQTVEVSALHMAGQGNLATSSVLFDTTSFTLDKGSAYEVSCKADYVTAIPSGRFTGECLYPGGDRAPWAFSYDKITESSKFLLTLYNSDGAARTGRGTVPTSCSVNGEKFTCDQSELISITVSA